MGDKKLLFVIAILIFAVSFLWIPNPQLTGFTVSEAEVSSLTVELESSKFAVDAPIKGTISLALSENLNPAEPITFSLHEQTYTFTIEELLKKANYSLKYEATEWNATNEAEEKSLRFTSAGSKFIGIKLPRYAEINDVSFALEASANNGQYPSALSMDVGNEGTIDWYYLGSFTGYNSTKISSEDLDGTKEGTGYIEGNTYYCELLSLPRTKDLIITAEYTKLGTEGDIQALALSVPTGNPGIGWSGGSDTCDLPESGAAKSCELKLDYTIEGEYLICIFSAGEYEEGKALYEIPLDISQETDTAYTCPATEDSICDETTLSNFFIYAQSGQYHNVLNGEIPIEEWETFSGAILTGIKYYVGSSPYTGICKTTTCSIPINISSETEGTITMKNLSLTYEYNQIEQRTGEWYDLEYPETDLTTIEGQILNTGATIEIPLETIDLKESVIGDYSLQVAFLNTTAEAAVSIREASEILDAATLLEKTTTKFNDFLDEETEEYQILVMIDQVQEVQDALQELEAYKDQVGFIEETVLLAQIEAVIQNLPWSLQSTQTNTETQEIKSTDIPDALGEEADILAMQNAISVKKTSKVITIESYNEERTAFILIKTEITANKNIEEATLYEISPLELSEIFYAEAPETSAGNQAEYTLNLKKGETETFYYLTTQGISLKEFQSIIVLRETEETSICGDFVCEGAEDEDSCPQDCGKGINVFYSSIPVILIIVLVLLFFFRKKILKKKEILS